MQKEKPPEPKPVVKKQEVKQFIAGPADRTNANKPNQKPAGKQLGLDAKGTAGGDSFGLVGNKGGAALIGGGGGGGLGSPFSSYGRLIETELDRKIKKRLEGIGGVPKGKFQVLVQIDLDARGKNSQLQDRYVFRQCQAG